MRSSSLLLYRFVALTRNKMPLCNSPTKSTTTARDFANSPPYSPAKTPARTYGSKGKNRIPSRQSATALAYQELEVLPLPTVHAAADSGGSETIDSDDEIIFISVRCAAHFILSLKLTVGVAVQQGRQQAEACCPSSFECSLGSEFS